MPSPETQQYLLNLYFTYVHPFYPVIHKQEFLQKYNARYALGRLCAGYLYGWLRLSSALASVLPPTRYGFRLTKLSLTAILAMYPRNSRAAPSLVSQCSDSARCCYSPCSPSPHVIRAEANTSHPKEIISPFPDNNMRKMRTNCSVSALPDV